MSDAVEQHRALAAGTRAADWLADSCYSFAYPARSDFEAEAYSWGLRATYGFTPEIREGAEVAAFEPNLADDIGCLASLTHHGYVRDPGGYVKALGAEVEALGGAFLRAEMQGFECDGDVFRAVQTSAGRLAGDAAVLTTGAWSKPLMASIGIRVPLESERGYHILFKGATGGPSHPVMLARGKFVATPMAEGLRCAGIVEFGGLRAGPSRAPFALLRRQTRAAFPNLAWDDEIEWQGHRPAASDSLPLIGEVRRSRIFTGFGHHHIGLTGGPKTGRLLAQLITGQAPNMDLTPYAPERFA